MKRFIYALLLIILCLALCACGGKSTAFAEDEINAVNDICGTSLVAADFADETASARADGRGEKFDAVSKVAKLSNGNYAFVSEPYGYKGIVRMVMVIDAAKKVNIGMRIMEYSEGEDYVRNWTDSWFVKRFADKSVDLHLELKKLFAEADNEIICVTGATISTAATVVGANAVFAMYKEYVLGETMTAVPRLAPGSPYLDK